MTSSIIIGIHGLLNKPPKETLQTWWQAAIEEGLQHNHESQESVPFELVYWADVRNPQPISLEELDEHYEKAMGQGPPDRYVTIQ